MALTLEWLMNCDDYDRRRLSIIEEVVAGHLSTLEKQHGVVRRAVVLAVIFLGGGPSSY